MFLSRITLMQLLQQKFKKLINKKPYLIVGLIKRGTTSSMETRLVELDEPKSANFLPFKDVIRELALGWAFAKMGAEKLAL